MDIGRYLLRRVVATDGAATVHEAADTETGQRVAVNRWPVDPQLSADGRERMRATALQAQGLRHPGLVELHEFCWDGEGAYAVTAFVEGETLARFLARTQRLPALQGLALSLQLLSALAAAHEHGLVHSSLNPNHVLMARNGQLKIAGFGWLAAAASAGHRPGVFDLPAYLAPEQILGRPADCRADLYSASVLAYEILTGSWPYQAHTAARPAREQRPELPAGLDAVFERALARDPKERHRNAAELAAALQAAFGMPVEDDAVVPVRPNRVVEAPPVAPAPLVHAPAPVAPAPLVHAPRSEEPARAPAGVRQRRTGLALVASLAAAVVLGAMFIGAGGERMRAPLAGLDRGSASAPGGAPASAVSAAQPNSPSAADAPLAAAPEPPPSLPGVQAVPATAAIEAPKPSQTRVNPKPVREAAPVPVPVPATAVPAEPPPRLAVESRAEPGLRETRVAQPIEAPPSDVASAPPPPPPPRPSETVEQASQRTAAAEPPQPPERSSSATAVMAAPPSPSPLNACRQESSMARELCVASYCAGAKYAYHPVCLRMYEEAIERHKLNRQDGP